MQKVFEDIVTVIKDAFPGQAYIPLHAPVFLATNENMCWTQLIQRMSHPLELM
jgi:hypothetical protein